MILSAKNQVGFLYFLFFLADNGKIVYKPIIFTIYLPITAKFNPLAFASGLFIFY